MSEQNREAVSALLDGELAESSLGATLEHLATEDALRGTMARYQLIGNALRGEGAGAAALAVAGMVRSRLAAEPAVLAPRPAAGRLPWRRAAAGLAVAASVAAVAVTLLPRTLDPTGVGDTGGQVAGVQPAPPPTAVAVPAATVAADGADAALARYLVDHNEFATRGAASGFMPYATLVTYDGR